MNYRALMRRKLLEQMYDRMTDEEKRLYVQMSMQDRDHREIMEALQQQKSQLDAVRRDQSWAKAYGSDLLANFTSAGILWLGSKILKGL